MSEHIKIDMEGLSITAVLLPSVTWSTRINYDEKNDKTEVVYDPQLRDSENNARFAIYLDGQYKTIGQFTPHAMLGVTPFHDVLYRNFGALKEKLKPKHMAESYCLLIPEDQYLLFKSKA